MQGGDEGEGSFEYLVFQKVLCSLAATFDLHPVTEYDDFQLDDELEPPAKSSDGSLLFRRFRPNFPGCHPSLMLASKLNAAFVLRKGGGDGAADGADAATGDEPAPGAATAAVAMGGKRSRDAEDAAAAAEPVKQAATARGDAPATGAVPGAASGQAHETAAEDGGAIAATGANEAVDVMGNVGMGTMAAGAADPAVAAAREAEQRQAEQLRALAASGPAKGQTFKKSSKLKSQTQ